MVMPIAALGARLRGTTAPLAQSPNALVPTGGAAAHSYTPSGHGRAPALILSAALTLGAMSALVVIQNGVPKIIKEGPVIVDNIPLPKPPEPPTTPEPEVKQPKTVITNPRPLINTPVKDPIVIAPSDDAPVTFDPGPVGTADPGPRVDPQPKVETPPAPVIVKPQLDRRYAEAFQPEYPPRELREGIEGTATVRVLVGTNGRVKQVELIRTDAPGFFAVTEPHALKRWRFKPGTRDGVPTEAWFTVTVTFEIKGE